MRAFAFTLLITISGIAHSASAVVSTVPTNWKIESYVGGGSVVLWFTGSPCASGKLELPGSATATDHNRLFTSVLTAKTAGKTMVIFYEDTTCVISSFGVQ
jgi:hypothetical protein